MPPHGVHHVSGEKLGAEEIHGGGNATRQALAAAVSSRVFFAGEATHTAGHPGTVHGAMESGQRAATEVLATV